MLNMYSCTACNITPAIYGSDYCYRTCGCVLSGCYCKSQCYCKGNNNKSDSTVTTESRQCEDNNYDDNDTDL